MVVEINIPGPPSIIGHETLVALRALILRIARQHALQAHADALYILDWRPPLLAQQIEADDAIRVDVGMHRYGTVRRQGEGHLWGF